SPAGHRIKAPLEYARGPDKTWVYGGLRVAGGQAGPRGAPPPHRAPRPGVLPRGAHPQPPGAHDLRPRRPPPPHSHNNPRPLPGDNSTNTRAGLAGHPRIRHAFITTGACWLNLQEAWWRIFRRQALAGQAFADPGEIALRPPGGHRPAQRPRPALGLGDGPAPTTLLPPPLYIHPLRNVTPGARPLDAEVQALARGPRLGLGPHAATTAAGAPHGSPPQAPWAALMASLSRSQCPERPHFHRHPVHDPFHGQAGKQ